VKVALVQLSATKDKKENVEKAQQLVRRAAARGAKFILLPEVFNYRGPLNAPKFFLSVPERIPGKSTKPFLSLAKEKKIHVLLGSVYEKAPGGRRAYNTSVLIDSRGRVRATYRKINLFDAVIGKKGLKESKTFKAGHLRKVVRVGEFKAGMSICYDLRFPLLYRAHAVRGANVMLVPSAFTRKTGEAHWKTLLRARAIENLSYVLAPNQIGKDARGVASYGHSMIVSPWGKILAEASGDREEILYADIKLSEVVEVRKVLPKIIGR
jgi:predicted amidohydrolase